MGGVTTLLYASTDQDFAGIIVDSPFSNLKQLALEVADSKISLPNFLLEGLLSIINNSIEERAGFRLDQIDVTKVVGKIDVPAVFVTSPDDKLIKQDHPKKLQSLYKGPSQLKIINGDHNVERTIQYKIFVAEFFDEQFKKYLEKKKHIEKRNEIPQQVQEITEIDQVPKQRIEQRHERSISSIIQNYGGVRTPNIQIGQNQNQNSTSSNATQSLDSNPLPISTGFTIIDTLKDAPQQPLSNTNSQINLYNKSFSLNNNLIQKQIQNYNNYFQTGQQDKNESNKGGESQDGNISARGFRVHHQKSASISKMPEGTYTNIKSQEFSKFQQESKGRTYSEFNQQISSNQYSQEIQNILNNIPNPNLNKQNNNFNDMNNISTSRELTKAYYFNQTDNSLIQQNSQRVVQNNNYYNISNSSNNKSKIIEDANLSKDSSKQKSDEFSTKLFFKTYENIRQQKVNKSPSKKISPKNERSERNQKYINLNEAIGGNKPHYNTISILNTSEFDTSRKSSENKTLSTNTNSHSEFEKQSNETEKKSFDKHEDNIRQHQKKVAINKFTKKRDSTIDIGDSRDQRLSTLQSVNDEFQEFEYANLNDFKDESTPGSKNSQSNNNMKKSDFRSLSQQYQIAQNGSQRQNINGGNNQSSLPPSNRTSNNQINNYLPVSSFSKQNQQQQSSLLTNLLAVGEKQQAQILKSPRINEKDEKIKEKQQNTEDFKGEQKVQIQQQSIQDQNEDYSQNFGYEKRVTSTQPQNQVLDDANKNNSEESLNQIPISKEDHYYSSSYNEFGKQKSKNINIEQFSSLSSKNQTDSTVSQAENIASQNLQKNITDQNIQKTQQETQQTDNTQQLDLSSNQSKNGIITETSTKTSNCVPSLTALESASHNQIENDNNSNEKNIQDSKIIKSNSTSYLPELSHPKSQKNSDDANNLEIGSQLKSTNSMKSINIEQIQNNQNINQSINKAVPTQMTTSSSTSNINYNMNTSLTNHHFNLNLIKQQSNESQYSYILDIQTSVNLNDKNSHLNNQKDPIKIDFCLFQKDAKLTKTKEDIAEIQTLKNSKVETVKIPRIYASLDPSPTGKVTKQNTQINKVQFQIPDKQDEIIEGSDSQFSKIPKSARIRDASLPLPSKNNYYDMDFSSGGELLQSINISQNANNSNITQSINLQPNINNSNITSHLQNNINKDNNISTLNSNVVNQNVSNIIESFNNQIKVANNQIQNNNHNTIGMSYQNMYSSVSQEYKLPQTSSNAALITTQQASNITKAPPLPPQNYHHIRQQSAHLPPKYQKVTFQQVEPNQIINSQNTNNMHQRQLNKNQSHHQHTSSTPMIQQIHSIQLTSDNLQQTQQIVNNSENQQPGNNIKDQLQLPPHTSNSTHINSSITNQISARSQTNSYHHYVQVNKPQSIDFGSLQGKFPDYLNSLSSKSQFYKVKQEQTSIQLDEQSPHQLHKNNYDGTSSAQYNRIPTTINQNNCYLNMYEQQHYPTTNSNQNVITKERYPIVVQEQEDALKKKEIKIDITNKDHQQAYEVSSPLKLKKQHNAMAEQCNNRSNQLKEQIHYKLNNMQEQLLFHDQQSTSSNQTKLHDNQIHLQYKSNSAQNDFGSSPSKPQIAKILDVKQQTGNHLTQNLNFGLYQNPNKSYLNIQESSSTQQLNSVLDSINYNNLSTRSKANSGFSNIPYSSDYDTPISSKNPVTLAQSHQQQPHHTKSYSQIDNPKSKFEFTANQYDNQQEQQLKSQNSQLTTQSNSYSASLSQQYTPQYSQKVENLSGNISGNTSTSDAVGKFKHFTSNNNYRSSIENTKINLNFQYGLPQKQQQIQSYDPQQINNNNNTQIKDNFGIKQQTTSMNKY